MLSGSYDKKICLWDLASGNGAPALDAHQVFEVMPRVTLLSVVYVIQIFAIILRKIPNGSIFLMYMLFCEPIYFVCTLCCPAI